MGSKDDGDDQGATGHSTEVLAYSDVDAQMEEFARSVELNERILHGLQRYELMLLEAANLPALLDVLVLATPGHFTLGAVSLRLHDPDGSIGELITEDLNYGDLLILESDSFDLQQLYGAMPCVELLAEDDPRAAQLSMSGADAQSMLLLPLLRDDLIVGSFHWYQPASGAFATNVEIDFISHLAAIIAICLNNCMNAERLSQLSLLDPLTRLSNQRALDMELRKEISRAQRNQKSLTLIMFDVDGLREISDNFGHLAGDFTLKAIANHILTMLRSTDYLARSSRSEFTLLLPACSESKGQEIAERMRSDTEFMEIDDGRGANLFASLSIGLVTWVPQNYPAINMEQLAGQILIAAGQGLERASTAGGNRISIARLTTILV